MRSKIWIKDRCASCRKIVSNTLFLEVVNVFRYGCFLDDAVIRKPEWRRRGLKSDTWNLQKLKIRTRLNVWKKVFIYEICRESITFWIFFFLKMKWKGWKFRRRRIRKRASFFFFLNLLLWEFLFKIICTCNTFKKKKIAFSCGKWCLPWSWSALSVTEKITKQVPTLV